MEGSKAAISAAAWIRAVVCWIVSLILVIGGLINGLDSSLAPRMRFIGAAMLVCGLILMPPALRWVRSRAEWAKPWWMPALFAVSWLIVTGQIARRLDPSALRPPPAKIAAKPSTPLATAKSSPTSDKPALTEQPQSAEANFAERAETYWIPQTRQISLSAPSTLDEYNARQNDLNAMTEYLRDGYQLKLDRKQQAVRDRLTSEIAAKQIKLLPILRRAYGGIANAQLFRRDVSVTVFGPRADTIRFTGPIFVRNANIADFQDGLSDVLKTARFRRVEYRWSRHIAETTFYAMKPPKDGAVGGTDPDGTFHPY